MDPTEKQVKNNTVPKPSPNLKNRSARSPRIFLGLVEISGFYWRLYQGLKELGVNVDYACGYHPFQYLETQSRRGFSRIYAFLTRPYYSKLAKLLATHFPTLYKLVHFFFNKILSLFHHIWFLYALFRYDIFIFGFGSSLLPKHRDLKLLRRFKKMVIANLFHGSEARLPYMDGAQLYTFGFHPKLVARRTQEIKETIARFEQYADLIVASPLTSHFFRKRHINYFFIGVPCPTPSELCGSPTFSHPFITTEDNEINKVRILHASSCPEAKGTSKIREVIERLRKEYPLEYLEISGKPHKEVIQALKSCDIVIDQLYSDTPMAGLATEAALFGKPVIVGGYMWEELKRYLPSGLWPPTYICHPDQLESALRDLLENPELRRTLGEKAQRFVTTFLTPRKVAERYLKLIAGEIPQEWWFDPIDNYVHATAIDEESLRKFLKRFIAEGGITALGLIEKPKLAEICLNWCKGEEPLASIP